MTFVTVRVISLIYLHTDHLFMKLDLGVGGGGGQVVCGRRPSLKTSNR